MRPFRIFVLSLFLVASSQGDEFELWFLGIGPINVHTALTYEGKGERLIAAATNDTDDTIEEARICIIADEKKCLFEFWNKEPWAPGASIQFDGLTPRRRSSLDHSARLEKITLVNDKNPSIESAGSDTVEIVSTPPGARIEVNGSVLGMTPYTWKIGSFALNPNKTWRFARRLETPLRLRLSQPGYVTRELTITEGPLLWTSLDGSVKQRYFVVPSRSFDIHLDKIGDFIGQNPFRTSIRNPAAPSSARR